METLDYRSPFTFFRGDKDWFKKFAVASLLVFTIVGITPVLGWTIEITRRVLRGEAAELPAWAEGRRWWKLGFPFWGLNLAWLLPVILSVLVPYLVIYLVRSLDELVILGSLLGVLLCLLLFVVLYSTVYIFLLPAAMGLLAGTGSLKRAINPLNAWRLARRHFMPHLIVFLIVGLGLLTVVSFVAPLTLFLGVPPLMVYSGMVAAHFAGQLYKMEESPIP